METQPTLLRQRKLVYTIIIMTIMVEPASSNLLSVVAYTYIIIMLTAQSGIWVWLLVMSFGEPGLTLERLLTEL